MQKFIILLALLAFEACQQAKPSEQALHYRQAAEFEPSEAIWLLWSNYNHRADLPNEQATLDIINALVPHVKVKLVVANDSVYQYARRKIRPDLLEKQQVSIFKLPYQEFWARDMGPSFVLNQAGQLAMADFNFNAWGTGSLQDSVVKMDETLDERVAKLMKLPIVSTSLITEGGNHEVNGKGVLMLTEKVERGRNPKLSLTQIEKEYQRVLGIKKVIWLKEGLHEDDHTHRGTLQGAHGEKLYNLLTTNGHVDEMARFVDAHTILLAQVDSMDRTEPIGRENHRRMSENLRILRRARDQDGKPFRIIPMPLPKLIVDTLRPGDGTYDLISTMQYEDGSKFPIGKPVLGIAAASYLNFLIANDCVLMPSYYKKGGDLEVKKRDAQAQAILRSVFPQKKIIPIDALAVNFGGGGIHCITINEPKSKQ